MKSLNMIGMAILKDSSASHAPCLSSSSCFLLFYKPELKESQTRISILDQSNIGFRTVNLGSTMTCIMLFFLLLSPVSFSAAAANTNTKTYVVHMKHEARPQSYATHHDWYSSTLQSLTSATSDSLLYAYTTAFQGFAATLSPEEAETLQKSNSVIGIYEDKIYSLHTTRTPQFLGLNDKFGFFDDIDQASTDIIIGVLDTGVWPESKSFDDTGMPAVPARWKGKCESGPGFSPKLCNKKLIGARFFSKGHRGDHKDIESPRDTEGHGTHTASTAAGSPVANASIYGFASGTARGMAPRARVAAYKVCWSDGCFESDILAAVDRAILDGVDVLSISIGGDPAPYYGDALAIGAFTAMGRGIFVSCSAGNDGPTGGTVSNVAPWIMTVGAGTLDRDFPARAILGHNNNKELSGASLYGGPRLGDEPVNLVYNRGKNSSSKLCLQGSLEPELVRGKVVVCDRGGSPRVEKGLVVRDAGGVGMILANMRADGGDLTVDSQLLPTLIVKNKDADMIREYARSDPNSSVTFRFGGTVLNARPAPVVAALSSRGPNTVTPQILKPDVIGPGINVLAAWSGADSPTGLDKDIRRTQFNIQSGTSMSCPHISGIAALVKAAHPNWSPSAIKSALMTSAFVIDNTNSPLQDAADGSPSNPFAHGSGYVDPRKALSPGLIYDISTDEYIAFLCSLDYSIRHVQAIVKRPNITCSKKFNDPGELNYPSFSVVFGNKTVVRYTRELTNVGAARSVYDLDVMAPATVEVIVEPANLVFRNSGDKLRYTATFVSKKAENLSAGSEFGSIVWRNEQHQVRSPIAFTWTHI